MSFSGEISVVADGAISTAPRGRGALLVSPDMQERIRHIAPQPGCVPNHVEKATAAELPRMIGAHVCDLHASHPCLVDQARATILMLTIQAVSPPCPNRCLGIVRPSRRSTIRLLTPSQIHS
jgi:hypothetical protein